MSCLMSPCHVISNVISIQMSYPIICLFMSCHMSYHVMSYVMSYCISCMIYVMLCNIISHVIICHVMSCHMSCYVMSYVMLCHVICQVISCHMSHHMSYQMMRKILKSTWYNVKKKNTCVLHGGGRGVLMFSLIGTCSQITYTTKTESQIFWWPNSIKGKRN